MKLLKTKFKDLKIIKLKRNKDSRGYLAETYNKKLIRGKELAMRILKSQSFLRPI